MELKNKIFAILAIFCIVLSACAVSAADNTNGIYTDGMYDGSVRESTNIQDIHHNATDNSTVNAAGDVDGEATHNSMVLPQDYAHSEMNATNATNATGHAAGENPNHANATEVHTLPATGNPILVLLAVGAVLGGALTLRRK